MKNHGRSAPSPKRRALACLVFCSAAWKLFHHHFSPAQRPFFSFEAMLFCQLELGASVRTIARLKGLRTYRLSDGRTVGQRGGGRAAGLWKAILAFAAAVDAAAAAEGRLWSVSDCRKNSIWFCVLTDTKSQCKKNGIRYFLQISFDLFALYLYMLISICYIAFIFAIVFKLLSIIKMHIWKKWTVFTHFRTIW